MKEESYCPTCLQKVKVVGRTTLSYEGQEAKENRRMREALEAIELIWGASPVTARHVDPKVLMHWVRKGLGREVRG